jgi:hypothetical protein
VEQKIITDKHAQILHQQRFLGNQSLHKFVINSYDTLKIAIEIIENMLDNFYEIDEKIETMENLMILDQKKNNGIKKNIFH